MKPALAAAAAIAALASACTEYPSPPPPPGAPPAYASNASGCFRTSDIRNHTVGDERTLYVDVQGREVWRIEMSGACLAGALSSDPIIIRQPPGASLVCRPIDLDIAISRGPGMSTPCIPQAIARLTPAEVAALPDRLRP